VLYWGESMMKFPAGNMSNPAFPSDFYAPYQQTFTINSKGDSSPSVYEPGELSRLDLDFGSTAAVIIPFANAPEFAVSADKTGYMHVVPAEANGSGVTVSMGQFQKGDGGLTSGAVSTQGPFQASQLPISPNTSEPVCPVNNPSNWTNNGASCDEIHEIAFLYNLAIVWPANESVEAFQGALSQPNGSGTYNYKFNTTAVVNPCMAPFTSMNLPPDCKTLDLKFPGAGTGGQAGAMAIASTPNGSGVPTATLWAIVTEPGEGNWGWLYAYGVDSTVGSASIGYLWDSGTAPNNCTNPPANGWIATAFTEPTVANGAAYVPSVCVVKTGGPYLNCGKVPPANIASGILVFSACPL
jgi:hypothetical protein